MNGAFLRERSSPQSHKIVAFCEKYILDVSTQRRKRPVLSHRVILRQRVSGSEGSLANVEAHP